jgi:hypothetical protein
MSMWSTTEAPAATAIWHTTPSDDPMTSTRSTRSASSSAGTISASW